MLDEDFIMRNADSAWHDFIRSFYINVRQFSLLASVLILISLQSE